MLFYLVGIKGAALSALAKILNNLGHLVAGVDVEDDFYTANDLKKIKLEAFSNMNLKPSYYYVIGNAYVNHSVTNYLINMNYKYDYYPIFLTKFFKNKKWLCVAGTHGKTTSTKLLATFVSNSTALIGDSTMTTGNNDYFILEACEYRNTFLNYHPTISLILNVDYDHVDFFKTKDEYNAAFKKFVNQSKLSVINGDEFNYRAPNIITYGCLSNNDVIFEYKNKTVKILNKTFSLPMTGLKYAYDFVGAYLVAKLCNISDQEIQNKLTSFQMPKRRYQKQEIKEQILILDYAHHPNEIKATFEAACEEYPNKKIICVFEPHTISRLQVFKDDFKKVLSEFNKVYLDNLFSSVRESHDVLVEKKLYDYLDFPILNYHNRLQLTKEKNCIICFLGAGNIDKTYESYLGLLNQMEQITSQ